MKRLAATSGFFTHILKILSGVVSIFLFVLLTVLVSRALWRDEIVVQPFHVAKDLAETGLTSTVVTRRLLSKIVKIQETKLSRVEGSKFATTSEGMKFEIPPVDLSKFAIPQTGLSVSDIVAFFEWRKKTITGEIVRLENGYSLTVLFNDSIVLSARTELTELDQHLQIAAENILKHSSPFILSRYYFAKDDYSKALKMIQYTLSHEPKEDDEWAINLRGLIFTRKKEYVKAIEEFKQAITRNPNFSYPYINWGNALMRRERFEEALTRYQKAVNLDPNYAGGYIVLGNAFFRLQQFGEAIARYKKAASLDPKNAEIYISWAAALNSLERYDEAITRSAKAASLDPKNAKAYYIWGFALVKRKRSGKAIEKFRKVVEMDPKGLGVKARLLINSLQSRP